jgi:acyl-CoA synthetase (AMP-forming)/AMP-acid ligase II
VTVQRVSATGPRFAFPCIAARARLRSSSRAFIALKEGAAATENDIVDFCRERLAHFKCPKTVVFGALPKTSTGKVQKFVLRDKAKGL